MNTFAIIDDDITVRSVLNRIIEQYGLGDVIGEADNGLLGEQIVLKYNPDIVLIDLLLPIQDGITMVNKLKDININSVFIMISQVSAKEMVANAYESGIEFFINKPINVIEVVNVVKKIQEYQTLRRTFKAIEITALNIRDKRLETKTSNYDRLYKKVLQQIMIDIGIYGDLGSRDLMTLCDMLLENNEVFNNIENLQLNELMLLLYNKYESEGKNLNELKTLEMRIRRTISKAMKNVAYMGIEDFGNEKFIL